jgi:hypothetical protein
MRSTSKLFGILLAEDIGTDAEFVRVALKQRPPRPPLDACILDTNPQKCEGENILKTLRSPESYAEAPTTMMNGPTSPQIEEPAANHAATVHIAPEVLQNGRGAT